MPPEKDIPAKARRRRPVRSALIAAAVLVAFVAALFFPPLDRALGGLFAHSQDGATIADYPHWLRDEALKHHRGYADYAQIPQCLDHAIMSVEDKRFLYHGGVDPLAAARALVEDAQNDHVDHGGSTITLQLARMMLHVPRRQPSAWAELTSQLRVMRGALIVEHDFSKQRILELYLNGVYLGRRAIGVTAAAQAYFHTPLSQVSDAQCIYMAGLPNDPTRFGANPSGDLAMARYHHVVATMQRNGYLTSEQAVALDDQPLFSQLSEN
ncbi:MAG TPA: biosynthetic peptidoglycan transglycosylase [Stellaceae bacterium]|nr:biosynthetic peptidoglycan transglycosylase [Stellaceae bacterium]